ncbi:MAG: thioredoxin domain-containing protein [Acidobacteria bacterium]|nr:thioredoxin domain-containing protein [Acidobacteriota bacterium]
MFLHSARRLLLCLIPLLLACGAPSPPEESGAASDWFRPAPGIEWQEWGSEAFARAVAADRPVWLYVTDRSSHWSHRMERLTFANADVVRLAMENYVPVRGDRDRHPELAFRCAEAAASAGLGGWPLSLFLTPAGEVFHAEGFLPPEDAEGRPGMRHVLQAVAEGYRDRGAAVRAAAADRTRALAARFAAPREGVADGRLLEGIATGIRRGFEAGSGGPVPILGAPDRPAPVFLLLWSHRTQDAVLASGVARSLAALADSAVHDPIGGGFHRQAAGPDGAVPEFEKPAATNAALLLLYLEAFRATGSERFRAVAEGIGDFLVRELRDPRTGAFFAGRSAEVLPESYGTYYTWTQEEVRSAAPASQAKVLLLHYDIGARGEIPNHSDRNVPVVAVPVEGIATGLGMAPAEVTDQLRRGKDALRSARGKRTPPPVDARRFADANGLVSRALLEGYRALGREDWREAGLGALDRLLSDHRAGSGLVSRLPAAEDPGIPLRPGDQAIVAAALLDAHEATGSTRYLEAAGEILESTLRVFRSPGEAALLDVAPEPGRTGLLGAPRYPVFDSDDPAANPLVAFALDRLSYLQKEDRYHSEAERILRAFAGLVGSRSEDSAGFGLALEHHLRHPVRVVVIGPGESAATAGLTRAAFQAYLPGKMVLTLVPGRDGDRIAKLGYPPADLPVAYVCTDRACAPPVFEAERLGDTMETFALRAFTAESLTDSRSPR